MSNNSIFEKIQKGFIYFYKLYKRMNNIIALADQICSTNEPLSYSQFALLINDLNNLSPILSSLHLSDNLIFVFCSMLPKSILNG